MSALAELYGRVAVVTGGASGLGLAMVRRFASEGMKVVVGDVEEGPARAVAREVRAAGGEALAVGVDVSRAEDVERLAATAYDAFGSVHVLCNNAGVVKSGRAWQLTVDDWSWVLGVDLWSVIHAVRSFVPRMIAQGEPAHIVNTASVAGILPMPNLAAYGAAKAGVVALSENLQLDLRGEGAPVGVSVLVPGYIPTRILESERNRPGSLAESGPDPSTPRTTTGVVPTMSADDVAELVRRAVVGGEFWILTHPAYRRVVEERAATVGTAAGPVAAPVW